MSWEFAAFEPGPHGFHTLQGGVRGGARTPPLTTPAVTTEMVATPAPSRP